MANPFVKIREQIVNDISMGFQSRQYVTASPTGDVLVSWATVSEPGRTIQIFDASGASVSPEFESPTPGVESPIWLADGTFALMRYVAPSGNAPYSLTIEQYARDGTLLASSPALSVAKPLGLVVLTSGDIVVTYESGDDEIVGQLLDPSFQSFGPAFDIHADADRPHWFEARPDGGFLEISGVGDDTPGLLTAAVQLFTASGAKIGDPIVRSGDQARVGVLEDGGFVFTVSREFGDEDDIWMQIYNADGTPRTAESQVNTVVGREASHPNVLVIDEDLFLVTWNEHLRDLPSFTRGQLFHVGGRKIGHEIVLDDFPGTFGWSQSGRGWSADEWGEHGFVTASGASEIELIYWDVDRDNILIGTAADEVFLGGGAAERIMVGFGGNDDYTVDSAGDEFTEIAGEGFDRVRATSSHTLSAGQSIEMLTTTDNLGTAAINLTGNALSQYIYGNAGANVLNGNGGGDVMTGFGGDDRYLVGNAADEVREAAGEGFDRVLASVSWRMAAGQHIEMLTTDDNLGTAPINFFGNEFSQYIYGNAGNNRLWGEGGGDILTGFGGDDTYYLVNYEDQVREEAGGGIDRIRTTVSVYLKPDQEIEIIESYDPAETYPRYLFANLVPNQVLIGNAGDNHLDGGGGGGDVMSALLGDDVYTVREMSDRVYEAAGEGFDRVISTNHYVLQEGADIEILATTDHTGVSRIDLWGNSLAQYVFGHAGVNRLGGGGGGDVLTGFGGDDFYDIVDAADQVREVADGGSDRILAAVSYVLNADAQVEIVSMIDNLATTALNLSGNAFAQYVYGNAGSNTLGGGAGRDVLDGLGGSDVFLFDTALNTGFTSSFFTLGESANVDRIDNFGIDDKIVLQGSLFGFTPGALPAGAFNTGTTASQADDRILWDGASGALLFDSDGTGAAAAQLIAFISNPFNLDSSFIAVI